MAEVLTPLKTVPKLQLGPTASDRDKEVAIELLRRTLNDVIQQYNELVTRLKDGTDI